MGGGPLWAHPYGLTATMPSISTEIWLGSITLPTAERAWRPTSPNTSTNRSEQPLMTFGESLKFGTALTMPSNLTMKSTRSSALRPQAPGAVIIECIDDVGDGVGDIIECVGLAPLGWIGTHMGKPSGHVGVTRAEDDAVAFAGIGRDQGVAQNVIRALHHQRRFAGAAHAHASRILVPAGSARLRDVVRYRFGERIEHEKIHRREGRDGTPQLRFDFAVGHAQSVRRVTARHQGVDKVGGNRVHRHVWVGVSPVARPLAPQSQSLRAQIAVGGIGRDGEIEP